MTSAAGTPSRGSVAAERRPQLGEPGERPGVALADGLEMVRRELGDPGEQGAVDHDADPLIDLSPTARRIASMLTTALLAAALLTSAGPNDHQPLLPLSRPAISGCIARGSSASRSPSPTARS